MTTYMLSYVSPSGLDWDARFTMSSDSMAIDYVKRILNHEATTSTYRLWRLDVSGAPDLLVRKFDVNMIVSQARVVES